MSRRKALKHLAAAAALTTAPAGLTTSVTISRKEAPRPNILLIMTDQQRFDQLGLTSGGHFETPNLDKLARGGIMFENAYTHSPICIPARGSLMTGLAPRRYPTQGMYGQALKEGYWTAVHAMRQAGYQTMIAGKMHFVPIRSRHGFEKMRMAEHLGIVYGPEELDDYTNWLVSKGKGGWQATHIFGPEEKEQKAEFLRNQQAMPFHYPKEYHPTSWVTREAIEMLEKRDKQRPYFLAVSYPHPHSPFDPPAPYDTMYNPADAIVPKDGQEVNEGLAPSARALMLNEKAFGCLLTSRIGELLQRRIATYIRALIRQIDDAAGELITHIDLKDTVVFFTSDHGDYYGHRGRMLKTPGIPFDDVARVPLFCAGAGIPRARREKRLVQSSDFALTCLDLAGIDSPDRQLFDARSLMPFFSNENAGDDRVVFCDSNYKWPMARRGNFKYFRNTENGEEMLFDLDKDLGETKNLAPDPAYGKERDDLRRQMETILARGIPGLPHYA
ncbi:MAG: sulfatase-like hydrolase/transferase [Candidatus Sumerlaeota bacterium]|nr:sulfatase-like hydrolase/transferase [Candidatus Sumerlaeota bacterium]